MLDAENCDEDRNRLHGMEDEMTGFQTAEFTGSDCAVLLKCVDVAGPTRDADRPSQHHLHLNLPPIDYAGKACFPETGSIDLVPIGRSFFRPAGYLMESIGTGGLYHSLRCSFTSEWAARTLGGELPWHPHLVERACNLESSAVTPLLFRIWHEICHPRTGHAAAVESLMALAVIELARFLEDTTAEPGRLGPEQMRLIDERLRCEDREPPSVADLAGLVAMSERHLLRLFQSTTGSSISNYIRRELVMRARRMLEDGDVPIKQVAHVLGFSGPSSFSLAFRRATGATPGQYRLRHARRNAQWLPAMGSV